MAAKLSDSFLAQRAAIATDPTELADVNFIQALDPSTSYVLRDETMALFARLRNYALNLNP